MRVSTKGRYALRLVVELAKHPHHQISLRTISEKQQISQKYLEQIIMLLVRAGYVISTRGPQGGYRLALPPEQITAGMIIRSMEGNLAPVACVVDGCDSCIRYGDCETLPLWQQLHTAVESIVDSVTLRDLIEQKV